MSDVYDARMIALENQVIQANAAKSEYKFLGAAFKSLRTKLVDQWASSDPRDEKAREKLYMAVNMIDIVEKSIKSIVEDGKVAQANLDAIKNAGERRQRFFRRVV